MDHGIHLRHAVVVRTIGVKTVKGVERCSHRRIACHICLPTARRICLCSARARTRAVVINGAVLAFLRLGIRGPSQGIVKVTEIGIVLFEDTVDGNIRNAAVAVLAPIEGPPLAGLLAGHSRAVVVELGRRLDISEIFPGIVIQIRTVGRPNVSIAIGGKYIRSHSGDKCRRDYPSCHFFLHK